MAKLLRLIDKRVDAVEVAAENPIVQGSVAAEIGQLAKTSQLLTGGATERIDDGDMSDDELRERRRKLLADDDE